MRTTTWLAHGWAAHTSFKRATPYGKALFGCGKMNFQYSYAYGRFADIAFGGGVDILS